MKEYIVMVIVQISPQAPMRVLAAGSAPVPPSAQPPINTSGIFPMKLKLKFVFHWNPNIFVS